MKKETKKQTNKQKTRNNERKKSAAFGGIRSHSNFTWDEPYAKLEKEQQFRSLALEEKSFNTNKSKFFKQTRESVSYLDWQFKVFCSSQDILCSCRQLYKQCKELSVLWTILINIKKWTLKYLLYTNFLSWIKVLNFLYVSSILFTHYTSIREALR